VRRSRELAISAGTFAEDQRTDHAGNCDACANEQVAAYREQRATTERHEANEKPYFFWHLHPPSASIYRRAQPTNIASVASHFSEATRERRRQINASVLAAI
jgi:hypothetical protein